MVFTMYVCIADRVLIVLFFFCRCSVCPTSLSSQWTRWCHRRKTPRLPVYRKPLLIQTTMAALTESEARDDSAFSLCHFSVHFFSMGCLVEPMLQPAGFSCYVWCGRKTLTTGTKVHHRIENLHFTE